MPCPSNKYLAEKIASFVTKGEPWGISLIEHINNCKKCQLIVTTVMKVIAISPTPMSYERIVSFIIKGIELNSIERPKKLSFGQLYYVPAFGLGYLGIITTNRIKIPNSEDVFVGVIPLDNNIEPADTPEDVLIFPYNENKMEANYIIQYWNERLINVKKLGFYIQDISLKFEIILRKTMEEISKIINVDRDQLSITLKGNPSKFDKYRTKEILRLTHVSYDFMEQIPWFSELQ